MFSLSETNSVVLTVIPVTKAGNLAAANKLILEVDSEYLLAEQLSPIEWLLIPISKLGETQIIAKIGDLIATVELRIVTDYRLEFVFGPPTEKVKLVAPDREFTVTNGALEVDAEHGVLNYHKKIDLYGHIEEVPREDLVAELVRPPEHGHVELEESDGSFVYFV